MKGAIWVKSQKSPVAEVNNPIILSISTILYSSNISTILEIIYFSEVSSSWTNHAKSASHTKMNSLALTNPSYSIQLKSRNAKAIYRKTNQVSIGAKHVDHMWAWNTKCHRLVIEVCS